MEKSKECSACGKVKPYSEFYKDSRNVTGVSYKCKQCFIEGKTVKTQRKRETNKDVNEEVVFEVPGFNIDQIICEVIKKALRYYKGDNLKGVAHKLGISSKTLRNRITNHHIDVEYERNNAKNDIKEKNSLDDYEPRELLKSLYDRGYDGHFFVYVKQEMTLSKLFGAENNGKK